MDNAILKGAGKTCALVFFTPKGASPSLPLGFQCITSQSPTPTDSPFGSSYVLSLGYLVVGKGGVSELLFPSPCHPRLSSHGAAVLAIPLGIINLDENALFQAIGVIILFVCIGTWGLQVCDEARAVSGASCKSLPCLVLPAQFMYTSSHIAVPMFSDKPANYGPVLSTLLYNFAYVTTIPSWLNERVSVWLFGARLEHGVAACLRVTPVSVCFPFHVLFSLGRRQASAFRMSLSEASYLRLLSTSSWPSPVRSLLEVGLSFSHRPCLSPISSTGAFSRDWTGADVLAVLSNASTPGIWVFTQICTFVYPLADPCMLIAG